MRKRILMSFVFGCAIAFAASPVFSQTEAAGKSLSAQLEATINSRVFANLPKASKRPPKKAIKTSAKTPIKTTAAKTKTTGKKKPIKIVRTPAEREPAEVIENESNALVFSPTSDLGVDRILADSFGDTPETRQIAMAMFKETMSVYRAGASKRGRTNDLGWAVTFFVVNCLNVYKNSPQASDAAVENTYEIVSELMAQSPEVANASDKEKQFLHDMLVYIAGSVVITDSFGKTNNQPQLSASARSSAKECLQAVLGINPDRMSFSSTGLVIK